MNIKKLVPSPALLIAIPNFLRWCRETLIERAWKLCPELNIKNPTTRNPEQSHTATRHVESNNISIFKYTVCVA